MTTCLRLSVRAALVLLAVWSLSACDSPVPTSTESESQVETSVPMQDGAAQPSNTGYELHSIRLEDGQAVSNSATTHATLAAYEDTREPIARPTASPPELKVAPLLWQQALAEPEMTVTVLVSFVEDFRRPAMPRIPHDQRFDSTAAVQVRATATAMVNQIRESRAVTYTLLAEQLADQHRAVVDETFWLAKTAVVSLPAGEIPALAAREDVLAIEPVTGGPLPIGPGIVGDEVSVALDEIDLVDPVPYVGGGLIGLIDSGVRGDHDLLDGVINKAYDCIAVPTLNPCPTASAIDHEISYRHGTSSASIVSGNGALGMPFRGATEYKLNSYKVYSSKAGTTFLDVPGALRAIQDSLADSDAIVLVQVALGPALEEGFSMSAFANKAYDDGVIVVAPNGNYGPPSSSTGAPARARKVIGVGAYNVVDKKIFAAQSKGPTPLDSRIKPDISAPTDTETGHGMSKASTEPYGGTSGAAPYAVGAAARLLNWMAPVMPAVGPGHVYAGLILAGQTPYPFDNVEGAGRIRLPRRGTLYWGHAVLPETAGSAVEVPITPGFGSADEVPITSGFIIGSIDAALWWPASYTDVRPQNVDLELVRPNGTVADTSDSSTGVFERARATWLWRPSQWKIRIHRPVDGATAQRVFFAALVRPTIVLFAGQPWYEAAPGTAEDLFGRLLYVPLGSDADPQHVGRFTFATDEIEVPVLSTGHEQLLHALVGRDVSLVGKRVDVDRTEGVELWIGEIAEVVEAGTE